MGASAIGRAGYEAVAPDALGRTTAPEQTGATDSSAPAASTEAVEMQDAVSVDVIPNSPPAEVLAAVHTAAQVADQLAAAGRHISFGVHPVTGRVQIELQDRSGQPISGLLPSDVFRIAEGGGLE